VIRENHTTIEERVSIINDFNLGKSYTIIYNITAKTAKCTIRTLTGKLDPPCLAQNAKLEGKITLGGVLRCDNWKERVKTDKGEFVVDILMVENINTPISIASYGENDKNSFSLQEFWNFVEKVNHDAFVIPSICSSSSAEPLTKHVVPGVIQQRNKFFIH